MFYENGIKFALYNYIMKYHRSSSRKSIRLAKYDYNREGWYFVTICTCEQTHFFGRVIMGNMILSGMGKIAHVCWNKISDHFAHVIIDEFIVMPHHIHGILQICYSGGRRDTACRVPTNAKTQIQMKPPPNYEKFGHPVPGSIPTILRSYKSAVTRLCHCEGYNQFKWQGRFYDHIIRHEKALFAIRRYIKDNPKKWNVL